MNMKKNRSFETPPYLFQAPSVSWVMLQVCAALLPGIAIYAWLISPAILFQLFIATVSALCFEALILYIRQKPITLFLKDGSAIVTAWLLALSLPPLVPWWVTITAIFFAIVVAKHLYGGLGQNPFNPAMVGFAVCIVAFPAQMSQYIALDLNLDFITQVSQILGLVDNLDAISAATPIDTLKTMLRIGDSKDEIGIALSSQQNMGFLGARLQEWVVMAYLLGGVWLIWRGIITWHIPLAFLASLVALAFVLWMCDNTQFASPVFHVFTGGTLFGAFFIATDPVSGASTLRGKLIFGVGCGLLTYIIRVFGSYPDGVAFAILLLNICVPLIDRYTQPPVFGMKKADSL